MIWDQNFLLRDDIPRDRLRAVLAEAFRVRPDDIALVEEATQDTIDYPVLVIVEPVKGDLRLILAPHPHKDVSTQGMWSFEQLAAALDTDIVTDDGSSDPYYHVMISPDGTHSDVCFEEEALDERREYVLVER